MFITHKHAEISLGAYLGDSSVQCWQYIEQTTHCPWFYVTVGRRHDCETLTSMILIPSVSALEQLIGEEGTDIWLLDVQLVSPAYLNGSDGWKMEKLLEIREAVDETNKEATYVYSLEGGHIYTEELGTCRSNVQNSPIIFSANRISLG